MMQRRGIRILIRGSISVWCAAALWLGTAQAQTGHQVVPGQSAPAAAPPANAAPPASPPAPPKEGFFDAVERWWDKSQADLKAGIEKMKDQMDALNARSAKAARDAAEATKEATDALVKLPNTRIIEGKEVCALAPNGSPDCQGAADAICRSKGFSGGKTANVEVTRKCSARALLSRSEADCTNETIVTRAACQ